MAGQAIWPIGGMNPSPSGAAYDFFLVWLALPILLVMWAYAAWRMGTRPHKLDEIDLDVSVAAQRVGCFSPWTDMVRKPQTGRRAWYTAAEMNAYRAERRNAPWYKRVYRILFTN